MGEEIIGNSKEEEEGRGGGEGSKAKFLKTSIQVNWDFQRGWRVKPKQPLKGGAGAFSGKTHCNKWTVL